MDTMPLGVKEIAALQRTWMVISSPGLETTGLVILHRLFTDAPSTLDYFEGMGLDKHNLTLPHMKANTKMAYHARSVATSISDVVHSLGTEEGPDKIFDKLSRIHKNKNVTPESFDLLGASLMKVITPALNGDGEIDEIQLWEQAYDLIKTSIVQRMSV